MLSNDPIYFRLEPYPPFKRDSYVVPQENAGVLQHAQVGEGHVAPIQKAPARCLGSVRQLSRKFRTVHK